MNKKQPILSNNRLDIENISTIATMFRENIKVLKWENYVNKHFKAKIPFAPFASLSMFEPNGNWLRKNLPNAPKVAPKGCDLLDVRWIPAYQLEKQDNTQPVACMDYDEDYSTIWRLSLVGIEFDSGRLMVWVPKENIWAEFVVGVNVSEAFANFLRAWF